MFPIQSGPLFITIEVFRAFTVIAGASCAARLIKVYPRYQSPPARAAGIAALLSFCIVLPLISLLAIVQEQAGGLASLVQPALFACFLMTHRYLNKAEEEASDD